MEMLRDYSTLIDDIKNSMSKLDKYKTKEENEFWLKEIEKDGKEMLEALFFSLITNGDYFFGNFAIQMDRKIDCLFHAPAGVAYDGYRFILKVNPLMFVGLNWDIKEQTAVLIHE